MWEKLRLPAFNSPKPLLGLDLCEWEGGCRLNLRKDFLTTEESVRGGWYLPVGFRASAWALCGGGRGERPMERCGEEHRRTWLCTHATSFNRPLLSEWAT